MVQDDSELLYAPAGRVAAALDLLDRSGVRTVRLTAGWSVLAPRPRAARRPRFDESDPAEYEPAAWRRIDRAVRGARERGMAVMIDIAFWAPRWATEDDSSDHPRQGVDPVRFGRFAQAVARRYDGDYDPPGKTRPLPAVRAFTLWNEPNLPDFLKPQWRDPAARRIALSPHRYRRMVQAAYPAVKSVQRDALVLIGGLAGYGHRGGVPPLRFIRELACVQATLRPLTGGKCANFKRLAGDGFAYHPYSTRTPPDRVENGADPDDAPLARIGTVARLLDRVVAARRLEPRLRDLYITEYGYETDPPDPGAPFHPDRAAQMWSWAEAIASRQPRVRSFAQFLVRDLPGRPGAQREGRLSDWQSGMTFRGGDAKPLVRALPAPLYAEPGAPGKLRVWARVRPGSGRRQVRIETTDPGRPWRIAYEGETDARGIFARAIRGTGLTRLRLARMVDGGWVRGPAVPVLRPGGG